MSKTILVFRSAALGDFILATPAFLALRRNFPGSHVVLLTTTSAKLEQRKKVEEYIISSDALKSDLPWTNLARPHLIDEVLTIPNLASLKGLYSARLAFAQIQFDLAIMFVDPAAPWFGRVKKWIMLKFISGMRVPVLGWRGPGSINGNRVRQYNSGTLRHHVHGPMQFLYELSPPRGYDDRDIVFDLRPGSDAESWADTWLMSRGISGKPIIALAPGSLQPHKQWPLSKYKELLQRILLNYPDYYVIIIGPPKDRSIAQDLVDIDNMKVFNAADGTTIPQSAALLQSVSLLIGNDGGAIHLGDAMGCKVVSIVPGIEYPNSIEPWNNKDFSVRWPVECAPCYSFSSCPQGNQLCMVELSVELVWAQCQRLL